MKKQIKILGLITAAAVFLSGFGRELSACDTWVALSNATSLGFTILAKNSDRPKFDCQPLVFYPRKKWPAGAELNLGRITIPQAEETYATIGSSPYWCWGYEEGINEFAVAIGNEGIWTKPLTEAIESYKKGQGPEIGPTGMDLLRLGLERGKTAREALEVITSLLEKHGQFGSGVPDQGIEGAYDNSYIIADPKEAWILETAGTRWIARRFTQGVASISNKVRLNKEWNRTSPNLIENAISKGWWPEDQKDAFDFEQAYGDDTDQNKPRNIRSHTRQMCSQKLLEEKEGRIDPRWMMRIARDRSTNPSLDLDQTASSCVAILPSTPEELPVFWWCAATPSSSCYLPFFIHGSKLPEIVSTAGPAGKAVIPPSEAGRDSFSENSYWWLFRDLCDKVNLDWEERNAVVRAEFDALENEFASGLPAVMATAVSLRNNGKTDEAAKVLDAYTAQCVEKAVAGVNELRARFDKIAIPDAYKPYVGTYVANFGPYKNAEFRVVIKNSRLAVDIPDQMVVELKEPDDEGLWYFSMTNTIAVSFERDSEGKAILLKFYQTAILPRKTNEEAPPAEHVPDEFKAYIGKYTAPMSKEDFSVLYQEGHLAIDIPNQATIELLPPDEKDRWAFKGDEKTSVSFSIKSTGQIRAVHLRQTFELPKKKEESGLSTDGKDKSPAPSLEVRHRKGGTLCSG